MEGSGIGVINVISWEFCGWTLKKKDLRIAQGWPVVRATGVAV
jgi:hypothetical protein